MVSGANRLIRMYDHPYLLPQRNRTTNEQGQFNVDLPFGYKEYYFMESMCDVMCFFGLLTAAAAGELLEHIRRLCGNHCDMIMMHWSTLIEPMLSAYGPSKLLVAKAKKLLERPKAGGQVTCYQLYYHIESDTYSVRLTDPKKGVDQQTVRGIVPNGHDVKDRIILPNGWTLKVHKPTIRIYKKAPTKRTVTNRTYTNPSGAKFRSLPAVNRHLLSQGEPEVEIEDVNSFKLCTTYIIDKARIAHRELKELFEWLADQPAMTNVHDPLTIYSANGFALGSEASLRNHIQVLPKQADEQGYNSDGDFVEEDNPRHEYYIDDGKRSASWSDAVPAKWNKASLLNNISPGIVHKSWEPSQKSTKSYRIKKKKKKKKK